ncbi:aspartic peptidase domain-containing protein [Crassisporium funariophilum]|nr:aspartic peptidase domain-containing protein [Crassisporium funariophilum]
MSSNDSGARPAPMDINVTSVCDLDVITRTDNRHCRASRPVRSPASQNGGGSVLHISLPLPSPIPLPPSPSLPPPPLLTVQRPPLGPRQRRRTPLAPNFSGILGLALPLNSISASTIPPVITNKPDGAAWASNLFSITPAPLAPASRFLSLSLSRPGLDTVPLFLGIGRHPAALVPDSSKIEYDTLVSERSGTLFWKTSVRPISVWVGGEERQVRVGRSNTGAVFPSAVLDSGVPLILTTSTIANGIYGAIGVHPASDGMYYVPCETPLNLTITLDARAPLALHPLDLTSEPPTDHTAQFCIGLIQTADAQLSRPDSSIGDIILGVPFMRNVYTVMAYSTPNDDGSFTPIDPNNPTDGGAGGVQYRSRSQPTTLRSGGTGNGGGGSISGSNTKTVDVGGKKLSIGILVLIGLGSFEVEEIAASHRQNLSLSESHHQNHSPP